MPVGGQPGLQPGIQPALPADGAPRGPGALAGEERGAARATMNVVPDDANRMLLITATREEYKRILGLLDRIDVQAEQGLLESTLAEVALNNNLRLGLKWFLERGKSKFTFTDSLVGAIAPTFPGFSYLFNSLNTQVVLDALSNVTDVNIVSSPTLTVLDGQRAELLATGRDRTEVAGGADDRGVNGHARDCPRTAGPGADGITQAGRAVEYGCR